MYTVCYPYCKKRHECLKTSIYSMLTYNTDIEFFIFECGELDEESRKDISKITNKITIVNVSPWMGVFHGQVPLANTYNTYMRLLMPRFFQIYRPEKTKFIYCDEDCYCVGSLDKFWNIETDKEFCGFSVGRTARSCCVIRRLDTEEYANNGLMLCKTSFDICNEDFVHLLKMGYTINKLRMFDVLSKLPLCDEFLLNIYGMGKISDGVSSYVYMGANVSANNKRHDELIKFEKEYGVIHTFGHIRNDENILTKMGIIDKVCDRKDNNCDQVCEVITVEKNDEKIEKLRTLLRICFKF